MAVFYNGVYNSVSEVVGPSGFYNIRTPAGFCPVYVDQSYDGGGWVCVLANRINTGGMNNLTYENATGYCNYRTGGSSQGSNTTVDPYSKLSGLANYNIWIGTQFWSYLAGRVTSSKVMVVQFVSATVGTALSNTAAHTKRYRWRFDNFNSTFGMTAATGISDETGTGQPGMLSYHAANGFSLTTYDRDQDQNGGNCSTYYNNNPFWYGSCWSGNQFAGNGYADAPYWDSSGSDYHNYGAIYIK